MRHVLTPCLLAAALQAQVPDGSLVASSFSPSLASGAGGLFLADPRIPAPTIPISGLGLDLTGPSLAGPMGARSIAIRQDDGALLVGEIAPPGHTVELHEITLLASSVATDTTTPVGTASATEAGAITQVALLPNGDALIGVRGLTSAAPLFGASLAIVRRDGAVVPLTALNSISNGVDAVAVDRAGTTGFAAVPGAPNSTIWRFSIPPSGAPTFVASLPGVVSLGVDLSGQVVAVTSQSGGEVVRLDAGTGTIAETAWTGPFPVAVQIERPTDHAFYMLYAPGIATPELGWIDGGGGTMSLTGSLTGAPSGLDVFDNPRVYGAPTPGIAEHRWQLDPTTGSLPRAGNTSFALRMTSTDSNAWGGLIASPRPASWMFFGVEILLDPAVLIPFGYIPSNGVVALPIPPGTPIGMRFCFQSYYLDAGLPIGAGASNGIQITIMP